MFIWQAFFIFGHYTDYLQNWSSKVPVPLNNSRLSALQIIGSLLLFKQIYAQALLTGGFRSIEKCVNLDVKKLVLRLYLQTRNKIIEYHTSVIIYLFYFTAVEIITFLRVACLNHNCVGQGSLSLMGSYCTMKRLCCFCV